MGNTFGGNKKTTKVMKIDGETMKLRTPVKAGDVLKDYPGLVLLESEAVKHYGVRAKALGADMQLEPKRLYFLVELPKGTAPPRRVRSGINMSAKDRLESLKLARRSASDLSIIKKQSSDNMEGKENGEVRLKIKLPKAEVEKLIRDSKDEAEAAQRIMGLCMNESESGENGERRKMMMEQQLHRSRVAHSTKPREKKVSFMPISQGGREIAVAS
ncbi:plastid movement impaired protein [Senna tora]|uniref:Plastid movement impaired protein n=1 Tax=Senna tora TaxID=362788 RepID=A0A834SSX9_9FABA|nr:plastid movement impaired protein [Senna tora]